MQERKAGFGSHDKPCVSHVHKFQLLQEDNEICGLFFTVHFLCKVSKKSSHCGLIWSIVCICMLHEALKIM